MDARGRITVVEAALTQSLCRHETRAQLIYRWLREADGSNAGLSILDRVQLLRKISAATDRQNIRVTDSKQNWLIFWPPPQNLLVDLKSIRAQVPGFTVFSGDLGDK